MLLKILHKDVHYPGDIDIFWLYFWRFRIRWFTGIGEWFIYIEFRTNKKWVGYRFSSAGNKKTNYKEK